MQILREFITHGYFMKELPKNVYQQGEWIQKEERDMEKLNLGKVTAEF